MVGLIESDGFDLRNIYVVFIICKVFICFYDNFFILFNNLIFKVLIKSFGWYYCRVNRLSKCYLIYLVKILWKEKFLEKGKSGF